MTTIRFPQYRLDEPQSSLSGEQRILHGEDGRQYTVGFAGRTAINTRYYKPGEPVIHTVSLPDHPCRRCRVGDAGYPGQLCYACDQAAKEIT